MSQSLTKTYVHIVFSTKHREPTIGDDVNESLYEYMGGICKSLESNPIKIGGYYDHIHILCVLSRKIALMKLVEDIKRGSSRWMKTKGDQYKNFYWQDGYGGFSVSPKDVDVVVNYIANQKAHHSKKENDFKTEYRKILNKCNVEFDERYVWD